MDETKVTSGIILQNSPFRERDSRVEIYSKDFGRIGLIARGTKSAKSKLRGHIEPFSFVRVMIVKGKKFNYLGSVTEEEVFMNLKEDYDKILLGSKILKIYLDYIKKEEHEVVYFDLLFSFLNFINEKKIKNHDLLHAFFLLKFLNLYGHKPELYRYLDTGKKVVEQKHCFSLKEGGLIEQRQSEYCLNLSVPAIKVLRLALENDFSKLNKLQIDQRLAKEIIGIAKAFFDYHLAY